MHTRHKHLHDETLTLPIHEHLQLHASQYKQKTQHPSHPLHKHTTNIPKDPHTVTTTDIKTNVCHIYTQEAITTYCAHHTLEGFQRLLPARGGTAQRKIFYLANRSQLIHPEPSSSLFYGVESVVRGNADSLLN